MSSKQALTSQQLEAVAREAFGPAAVLRAARELTEGTFNTAYGLVLADGRPAVLKVAPPPEAPVLTYEQHLLHTEALCLRAFAERTTVPVPRLLHASTGSTAVPRAHLITSVVPGGSWASQAQAITTSERRLLRRQLGRHVAAMHQVTGEGPFGYPVPGSPLTGETWTAAFQRLITALVADAERFAAPLPLPAAEIHQRLAAAAETALDAVQVPVLVHFDLWAGNIFIDRSPEGPVITGLIDHERAFWGDPPRTSRPWHSWPTSPTTRTSSPATRTPAGRSGSTPPPATRLHLYRAHLALVMLVEAVPRRTTAPITLATTAPSPSG